MSKERVFDVRYLEYVCVYSVSFWGIWLLNPYYETFTVSSKTLSAMASIAPENGWGLFGLLIGVIASIGFYYNKREVRALALSLTLAYRVFIFLLVGFSSSFQASSTPDFLGWIILTILVMRM